MYAMSFEDPSGSTLSSARPQPARTRTTATATRLLERRIVSPFLNREPRCCTGTGLPPPVRTSSLPVDDASALLGSNKPYSEHTPLSRAQAVHRATCSAPTSTDHCSFNLLGLSH